MKELETMINAPHTVTLSSGTVLEITPIRVKELPALTAAVEPIFALIAGGMPVSAMLASNSDAVIAATAIGLRMARAELDEFELDDLVVAAAKVMEVNADFFARRVLPALNQATVKMSGTLAGLMQSIDSSQADTGSATS